MKDQLILEKVKKLKPAQQEEALDFIEFLAQKYHNESPSAEKTPLKAGFMKGTFVMKEGFDDPLDDFMEPKAISPVGTKHG